MIEDRDAANDNESFVVNIVKEKKSLHKFDNTDINFKRRKIRIGDNFNININSYFKDEYDYDIDECYERGRPKKVFSGHASPLSKDTIDEYLRNAMFFWDYNNMTVEEELCSEFHQYIDDFCKKIDDKEFLDQIEQKVKILRNFVSKGVHMNNHFEEMALKILHISKYSTKKALYFLFKKMNPFLEEEIEGFKCDVNFLQREAFVVVKEYENESPNK